MTGALVSPDRGALLAAVTDAIPELAPSLPADAVANLEAVYAEFTQSFRQAVDSAFSHVAAGTYGLSLPQMDRATRRKYLAGLQLSYDPVVRMQVQRCLDTMVCSIYGTDVYVATPPLHWE